MIADFPEAKSPKNAIFIGARLMIVLVVEFVISGELPMKYIY
jgi:hypothetical protein